MKLDRASPITQLSTSVPNAERKAVSQSIEHERNHFCNLVQDSENTADVATQNCQAKHSDYEKGQLDPDSHSVEIEFKTMLISQFLEPLFKSYTESMFGKGLESDMYKSLFSEAVAKSVAKNDGIGIGNYIDGK